MDPAELRAAFPVFERFAYLNAGTCGPIPQVAVERAHAELEVAALEGRWLPHFERLFDLHARQRAAYAERIGAKAEDVSLTTSTSDGVVRVLGGLDLGPEDEVITSDEEHPGVLGPLSELHRRTGAHVRVVPFPSLAEAVGPSTKLVACSHVSWIGGAVAPEALREVGREVPVLLDGAQGAGAIGVDVAELGCAFYAAAGQKWLCGPIGSGLLYVSPDWRDAVAPIGPTYINLAEPGLGLDARPHADARRHDASALSAEASAFALAAHDVVAEFGWDAAAERAVALAERLADELRARGREVAPRGRTTLVAWEEDDPVALKGRAAEAGVVIRDLPGRPFVRASVGAWNDESDLERLLALLS